MPDDQTKAPVIVRAYGFLLLGTLYGYGALFVIAAALVLVVLPVMLLLGVPVPHWGTGPDGNLHLYLR